MPAKTTNQVVKVTPEMIKVLFEAEKAKLEDPRYPGGGFNPPYGPSLNHLSHNYDRYAYLDLLKAEWLKLTFD